MPGFSARIVAQSVRAASRRRTSPVRAASTQVATMVRTSASAQAHRKPTSEGASHCTAQAPSRRPTGCTLSASAASRKRSRIRRMPVGVERSVTICTTA